MQASTSPSFALFLVFLILKLTHVIAWSWLWVTSPLWIGLAVSLVMFFIFGVVFAGAAKAKRRTFR